MSYWEKAPGKTQDSQEEVGGVREVWVSLRRLLSPRPRYAVEEKCMDHKTFKRRFCGKSMT